MVRLLAGSEDRHRRRSRRGGSGHNDRLARPDPSTGRRCAWREAHLGARLLRAAGWASPLPRIRSPIPRVTSRRTEDDEDCRSAQGTVRMQAPGCVASRSAHPLVGQHVHCPQSHRAGGSGDNERPRDFGERLGDVHGARGLVRWVSSSRRRPSWSKSNHVLTTEGFGWAHIGAGCSCSVGRSRGLHLDGGPRRTAPPEPEHDRDRCRLAGARARHICSSGRGARYRHGFGPIVDVGLRCEAMPRVRPRPWHHVQHHGRRRTVPFDGAPQIGYAVSQLR